MELIAGILIASLVPEEALRFRPIFEQESEESCAFAALASLLSLYCGIPATEGGLVARLAHLRPGPSGAATLGDALLLLADAGLRSKAFRMDLPSLRSALDAGYIPLLIRYERPRPHFALLIGSGSLAGGGLQGAYPAFALADPARGLEILTGSELERRWGGVAVLVERAAVTKAGRSLAMRWTGIALGRMALLLAGEAEGAARAAADRAAAEARARGGGP